jgi:hypothetical protein
MLGAGTQVSQVEVPMEMQRGDQEECGRNDDATVH